MISSCLTAVSGYRWLVRAALSLCYGAVLNVWITSGCVINETRPSLHCSSITEKTAVEMGNPSYLYGSIPPTSLSSRDKRQRERRDIVPWSIVCLGALCRGQRGVMWLRDCNLVSPHWGIHLPSHHLLLNSFKSIGWQHGVFHFKLLLTSFLFLTHTHLMVPPTTTYCSKGERAEQRRQTEDIRSLHTCANRTVRGDIKISPVNRYGGAQQINQMEIWRAQRRGQWYSSEWAYMVSLNNNKTLTIIPKIKPVSDYITYTSANQTPDITYPIFILARGHRDLSWANND